MEKREYNYGIALLRIFFCYMVVSFHFYGLQYGDQRFYFLRELAVPMFVFISFYFGYKLINSNDNKKYLKRAGRLFVPYLFWGIVPYIGLWIVPFFTAIPHASLRDLFMQVFFGSNERLNAPLWFMWEIMVLTILFVILYKIFRKYTSYVLVVLIFVAYVIQYLNINSCLYEVYHLPYEVFNDIGRFFEVLPLACAGYIVADINLAEMFKEKRWFAVPLFLIAFAYIFVVEAIPTPEINFAYAGVKHIIIAPLLFIGFYIIPFEKIPEIIKKCIKWVAMYTMGIYFMHWIVGKCMNLVWMKCFGVEKTLTETFVIFIVCLIACYIVDKIPLKYTKMLVK